MKGWDIFLSLIITTGLIFNQPTRTTTAQESEPYSNPEFVNQSVQSVPQQKVKINVAVRNTEDLKVRVGDSLTTGQVISDRQDERQRLESRVRSLSHQLKQVESQQLIEPLPPLEVPEIPRLPDRNFELEESAIEKAKIELQIAQNRLQQFENSVSPLRQIASVKSNLSEVAEKERRVEIKKREISAIGSLRNLPNIEIILEHEQNSLSQLESQLNIARSNLTFAKDNLEIAKLENTQRLSELRADLLLKQSNLSTAIAALQKAQSDRAYLEYEHRITVARRLEESNQAQSFYNQQMQRFSQAMSDKAYRVAILEGQIQDVQKDLENISTVRSPYSGKIRRVKLVSQQNNTLNYELILVSLVSTP